MARGRGAKKSAQKRKNKKTGPSSSPIKKTRSIDELTGIAELEIPTPIQEKTVDDAEKINEVMAMNSPVTHDDQLQKSREKIVLS